METINAQLVLQHCCKTSWNAMLHILSLTNQPGLAIDQVVVNLICCTGLNVGGKTRNIATIAGLQYFAKRNETKRNGTLRNGTLRNGTLRNGTLRNGYTTQRFITPYLEYLEFH